MITPLFDAFPDSSPYEGVSQAAYDIKAAYQEARDHFQSSLTSERAGLRAEFRTLAHTWKEETKYQSSPTRIAMHPAYQRIIGMGQQALPLILKDLEETHAQWFWALRAITGFDPVSPEDRGYIYRMVNAWVAWGIRKQIV